ncbi:hypothetical protein FSARC_4787 [Fusarium sarcochroum]|uniref:Sterol uptake control protein 2 n=1 Tax=Fusarium sarcochroum TaxID=1208366 RepID=A0A8H4XB57_9HYPO|nr:hypothetical protein FSARC_4787 [Fusarium sarcochroum]
MTGRECSFASRSLAPTDRSSVSDSSSRDEQLLSPGDSHRSITAISTPGTTTPVNQDPTFDNVLNMEHMELFVHVITNKDLFNLGDKVEGFKVTFDKCLSEGIKAPYLLHQVLAFAARHLAAIRPERSAHYLHQAVSLQTRAVSLFNSTNREVNRTNCVAVLLFSVSLGHHLLADALANRGPDGLDGFLAQYVQCVDMNRGIYNVARSAWPLLLASELAPVLSFSSGESSREPKGSHCQPVVQLVNDSTGLREDEKEACQQAIQYLQVGFDAMFTEEEEAKSNRFRMIFQWTMLASPELTSLLAEKRPEALVLLGYYALLLHYGRNLWQIGDTGSYLLGLIVDYLRPEWHFWLDYPREMLRNDLEHAQANDMI